MVSGTLDPAHKHCIGILKLAGQQPQRGQCPIEYKGNLCVRLFICPSIHQPIQMPRAGLNQGGTDVHTDRRTDGWTLDRQRDGWTHRFFLYSTGQGDVPYGAASQKGEEKIGREKKRKERKENEK